MSYGPVYEYDDSNDTEELRVHKIPISLKVDSISLDAATNKVHGLMAYTMDFVNLDPQQNFISGAEATKEKGVYKVDIELKVRSYSGDRAKYFAAQVMHDALRIDKTLNESMGSASIIHEVTLSGNWITYRSDERAAEMMVQRGRRTPDELER